MTLSLLEISQLSFATTQEADAFCESLRRTLGFTQRYPAARLAIARSLTLPIAPTPIDDMTSRTIRAAQLLGTGADLAAWVAVISQRIGRPEIGRDELRRAIAAHWSRGAALLMEDWEEANQDLAAFIGQLSAVAGLARPADEQGERDRFLPTADLSPRPVELPLGNVSTVVRTGERLFWSLNAAGGSPHSAVMGGIGSGKTRTAAEMLRELHAQMPVPMIAFDFKGDMADEHNALDKAFGATVIAPPHNPVPLDVLALADHSDASVTIAAQRLRDSLTTLKGTGFGAVQKGLVGTAAETAMRRNTPCRLEDVRDALAQLYETQGRKPDGASVTMDDLCRFDLFKPQMSPKEFFGKSWIIRLSSDLPDLVRVSTVTLITDALDRYLNSLPDAPTDTNGARALRVLCVIDEAHRILGARLPGLTSLIRLSRSKGGAIMLISQSPDDFEGEEDDFLSEMGLVLAFSTNANPRAVKRLLPSANLAGLETGQAWAKLRGHPAAELIQSWKAS